jgi:hypothetical protein
MDQSFVQRILAKIGIAIMAIALIDLVYLNWWVLKDQKSRIKDQNLGELRSVEIKPSPLLPASGSPTPSSSLEPKTEIKTVETKTIVEKESQTIVQTAQKEIFIPIGSGSTFSSSYVDLSGLEVTIDTNKYSAIESVVFESSIWVQDGNGKMYAQLYNASDKHPVWNSEISTNSASGVLTTSSKIILDSGSRTYRVQAKTNLTAYGAHVDNARLKIVLK